MRVLAADVGGSSTRAALISDEGAILGRRDGPTPQDPDNGLALLRRFWGELGSGDRKVLAVAGGIRTADGELTRSPNLPQWEGTRLGRELDCEIVNDANAALLGEAWLGTLKRKRSALLLTLGTGVGGGVLLDGWVWTGSNGCAGEIGHVPVWPDGPEGSTGARGYLELYASARGVAKASGTPDGRQAADLARRGNPRAMGAFREAGRALGIGLAGLVNVFNPEAICLAGGMAAAFDLLEGPLQAELEARAFPLAMEGLDILCASLGGDAGLLGAGRFGLQAVLGSDS